MQKYQASHAWHLQEASAAAMGTPVAKWLGILFVDPEVQEISMAISATWNGGAYQAYVMGI